jgi:hypothetical protein
MSYRPVCFYYCPFTLSESSNFIVNLSSVKLIHSGLELIAQSKLSITRRTDGDTMLLTSENCDGMIGFEPPRTLKSQQPYFGASLHTAVNQHAYACLRAGLV